MWRSTFFLSWLDLVLVLAGLVTASYAKYVPLLQPGFFFDYNIQSQPVPIPITEQCETIHLKWGREGAIGPNPVAPYSMLVYTSTFITPFSIDAGENLSFDWDVPFAPGTQYQICMWDKNGVPGGCQAMYTVVQNSTVANPSCQNVTFPTLLDVQATVPGGPMSQYGFIDQCTDLFITPKSGKPPFTLTVAPALHPPYNITSNSMDPIDWTVSLSWSFPFFLSLVSSDGQMWSNGPLHAGGRGSNDCLAPGTIPYSKAQAIAAGAGIGAAFAAGLLGGLGAFLYLRLRPKPPPHVEAFDPLGIDPFDPRRHHIDPFTPKRIDPFDTTLRIDTNYRRDHQQPQITETLPRTAVSDRRFRRSQMIRSAQTPSSIMRSPETVVQTPRSRTTYILHHDAGQAPVTVITDAEEVVELPPRYRTQPALASVREKPEPALPPEASRSSSLP
ncbi:hypothetical protein C8F04DRAFT_1094189 [Mycena alexandri]|uniref:Uncharacterized protein n=1 Tax=Mycena alexandri TaxID=1745969 RepID=A0AAD6SZK4_9AGAR|nr:hypothetical protein C8F04DRAFT_1094189 [Mycena alexandri]